MPAALAAVLILAAQPCGDCVGNGPARDAYGLCESFDCHVGYYKRLYYGHYDRHPFDYRFQFDYLEWAGPSQPQWPIPPLPACESPGYDVLYEGKRPARPADASSPRTTLKLRGVSR